MNDPFVIIFTRDASREIREAKRWWRANRTKAPRALDDDLQEAFDLLATTPGVGTRAENVQLAGVRRLFLKRVHYFLYYRILAEEHVVEVAALWHARRGSGPRL